LSIEAPIKLGPNTYYFHGDLWTAEELKNRWGLLQPNETSPQNSDNQPLALTTVTD